MVAVVLLKMGNHSVLREAPIDEQLLIFLLTKTADTVYQGQVAR
jgi:hypothetical protein